MNKKLLSLSFVLLLLMIGLVSAVPPVTQVSNAGTGMTVFYPKYNYVMTNQNFSLHFHVINTTTLILPIATNKCFLHIYNTQGEHTLNEEATADSNGVDFKVDVLQGNFTDLGQHAYIIYCNNSKEVGGASGEFYVTKNGILPELPQITLYVSGLAILLIILISFIIIMFSMENPFIKAGSYLFAHLFTILFLFSTWTLFDGYLIGFVGLQVIFKVLFYVAIASFFPMLLSVIAFAIYISVMHDEMQQIMEKGISSEEAYKRINKKWSLFSFK